MYSFVSASFAAHLAGELYQLIIKTQSHYCMQMSVSGDATGTGKSLLQSVWMVVFTGEPQTTLTSVSEAQAYKMLNRGENIYGK